jgi:hypothetical protein
MPPERTLSSSNPFGALKGFARRGVPGERCELCGSGIAPEHEHLIEPEQRRLTCACQACAILFSGQSGQRYKRVPLRIRFLTDFQLTDTQWESLMIPINLAFFVKSAAGRVTAVYPSPAGATESLLPLETWDEIVAVNPELRTMEEDVEALLVNRLGAGRGLPVNQHFLLPIDQCFKVVGLVRMNWRGLSGGEELWQALERHFGALTVRAESIERYHHA